ncbi:hypothetical protein BuS5_01268 [Desulfosarcina sp. BuS5]|nr:hypothetical protein BuS5_01268 [Desulfosarcina sp. BuS5]
MARPLRITCPGAFYHVTSRGKVRNGVKSTFDPCGIKNNAEIKANAGIYLLACTSFRSILLFTAAAYLITLLRLGNRILNRMTIYLQVL